MVAAEAREPPTDALPRDLVFVDLETTGANAAEHRIIEIGMVRMRAGVAVEEWSSLVNPGCLIPAYIESFTGISNGMVASAPRFADIADLVLEKLGCAAPAASLGRAAEASPLFVAHNARFDYAFLRAELRRMERRFSARVLCTVKLSRRLFPAHRRHNLDAVMERHGLACSARHRALGDARLIGDFWRTLCRDLPEQTLAAAVQSLLRPLQLPQQLPEGLAEELPEAPGVYRFYGEDDGLLYVGRAASVRSGVLGVLAQDRAGGRDAKLRAAVRRVEWQETAGELGALLCELDWLRTEKPLHNRRLPRADEAVTIRIDAGDGAACVVALGAAAGAQPEDCFGVFHAAADARKALSDIARARELCPKILGLEQGEGSCLGYQLGRCRGACIGKEPLLLHAIRVRMALSSLKLRAWPFPGRVALRERGAAGGAAAWHVVDRWSYLGTAHCEEQLEALAQRAPPDSFDAHAYRVLVRYLANHPGLDWRDLEAYRPRGGAGPVDLSTLDVS